MAAYCGHVQAIQEALTVQYRQESSTGGSGCLPSAAGAVQDSQQLQLGDKYPVQGPVENAAMRLSDFNEVEPSVISLGQGLEEAPLNDFSLGPGYLRGSSARAPATTSSLSFGGEAIPEPQRNTQSDGGEDVSRRLSSTCPHGKQGYAYALPLVYVSNSCIH